MYNYVGSIYIAQIDSEGSAAGTGTWTNISAVQGSTSGYIASFSDSMTISYNSIGCNYGLLFTNVNLASYGVYVTYIGVNGPTGFTSSDPYNVYTYSTTGLTPSVTTGSTYTSFTFWASGGVYNGSITFGTTALLLNNSNNYSTFLLDGTKVITSTSGGEGASCLALTNSNLQATTTTISFIIGQPSSTVSSITINEITYTTSNPGSDFVVYAGGSGGGAGSAYNGMETVYIGGGGGGAGGTTSVGGSGKNGSNEGGGGEVGSGTNGVGKNGLSGSQSYTKDDELGGSGGGGELAGGDNQSGENGAINICVSGVWTIA
jgi:hypothetical protein